MLISRKIRVTVTLELAQEEAEWLRDLLQNYSQDEVPAQVEMRMQLLENLQKALPL